MKGTREFGNALVVTIVSIGLILGALSISLVGSAPESIPTATDFPIPSQIPLTASGVVSPTFATAFPSNTSPAIGLTATPTSALHVNCQAPFGWIQITVRVGDTLESIAATYRVVPDELRRANCLLTSSLIPGSRLYIPPVSPSTSAACTPGAAGWIKNYTVQPGENLYRIGFNHFTTLEMMRKVNCRVGDTIYAGEVLWVPNIPATRTSNPTTLPENTLSPLPTDPLTETALPYTATFIPTSTLPSTITPSLTTAP